MTFDELPESEQQDFAAGMGEFYLEGLKRKIGIVKAAISDAWNEAMQRDERRASDAWNQRSDLA